MAREMEVRDILDRIDVGVVVLDRGMKIAFWNRFMSSITGRSSDDVLGCDIFSSFTGLPEKWLRRKCNIVFLLGQFAFGSWEQQPFLFECKSRFPLTAGLSTMRQDCTFFPLKSDDGEVTQVCIVIKDVTETAVYQKQLKQALAEIEEISLKDGLTGIPNRRSIDRLLEDEFNRHKRYGSPLSVAILDIDNFKSLNDAYGHLFGDEVLRSLAQCLDKSRRTSDAIGRFGGEEFMLILPGLEGHQAWAGAERLRQEVERLSFLCGGERVPVTVSIGVCGVGPRHTTPVAAIREADGALYQAKEGGRNLVIMAAPPNNQTADAGE